MDRSTLGLWADHVDSAASRGAGGSPADGAPAGFLAWAQGHDRQPAGRDGPGGDEALWGALAWGGGDDRVDRLIGAGVAGRSRLDAGALFPHGSSETIEVWTERELSALHALWWLARVRTRPDWSLRADAAARWHVAHTQPDNATNRPWALHVFLLLDGPDETDGRLYAETLLHNCQTLTGVPSALCALILRDTARALREAAGG